MFSKIRSKYGGTSGKIMELIKCVQNVNEYDLQKCINRYVISNFGISDCAQFWYLHYENTYCCSVVGENMLDTPVFIPNENCMISQVYATRQDTILNNSQIDIHRSQLAQLFRNSEQISSVCYKNILHPKSSQSLGVGVFVKYSQKKTISRSFIKKHDKMMLFMFSFLQNAYSLEHEKRKSTHNENFLKIIKKFFSNLDDLNLLLNNIMEEAKLLTNSECCSLFLKEENELVSIDSGESSESVRIPLSVGIAGNVATTGKPLNIQDAYKHPLFYSKIDEITGFKTRNILCFPIKNDLEQVIAVAQLCNKKMTKGTCNFTDRDEILAHTFSLYCYLSISHSLMYKKLQTASERSKLASEMMLYYMKVDEEQINTIMNQYDQLYKEIDNIKTFDFSPRVIKTKKNVYASIAFKIVMELVPKKVCKINERTLAHFICAVRNGYRNLPYHNWVHAFTVTHFFYLINKFCNLKDFLPEKDIFALVISCLCHDLDHRGTSNTFQKNSRSSIASLYTSHDSVMEEHHFAQTLNILNVEGCNIFENYSKHDYGYLLETIHKIILATDLCNHLKNFKEMKKMADDGFDRNNERHVYLLMCLIMTACDLSDTTKGWENSKITSLKVYKEFNNQGDLEESLNQKRSFTLNNVMEIPKNQIQFVKEIAVPVYKLLYQIIPELATPYNNTIENCEKWENIQQLSKEDLLKELDIETVLNVS